jgi:hypothetical protein
MRWVKCATVELPVQEVRFLAFSAVGFNGDVSLAGLRYALNLADRSKWLINIEIMQRVDGHYEIETVVCIG